MPRIHAPRTRWTAAALHLALSFLLIGTIALATVLLLFPAGLYRAANLGKLFEVMLAVDVTVGPLLTLLLYRPGKWGLKFDMACIALLQAGFLAYGLNLLWQGRPLFLVGSTEAFALVFADEVPADAAAGANAKGWQRFHGSGPWLVGVDAQDKGVRDDILGAWFSGQPGPLQDPHRYLPYPRVQQEIVKAATARPHADALVMPLFSQRGAAQITVDASGTPLRATP